MSSTDSGYMQYLAYLQSQAAQAGAIQMLQQEISDNENCNQFGNLKDTVTRDSHILGEKINAHQLFNAKEFCDLAKEVTDNERNVVNNINRTSSDTQTLLTRDGIATRLAVTDGNGMLKDTVNSNAQWIRSDISNGNSNLKDTLNVNTQWVRDDVLSGNANLKDTVTLLASDNKDNIFNGDRWLHENIINSSSNLKDTLNQNSFSLKDSVNQQAASLKDTVNQQSASLKDSVNQQSGSLKDSFTQQTNAIQNDVIQQSTSIKDVLGAQIRDSQNAIYRTNTDILSCAAQTQYHIDKAQSTITQQAQQSAFESRLGIKDLASDIKDKFGYGLNNITENLSHNKYEQLKNQEQVMQQMYKVAHDNEKNVDYNFKHTNEKLCSFEHNVDKAFWKTEQGINSNIDGNFRFTNEKLFDAKYEALKNKEHISAQLTHNQFHADAEISKVQNDLSKQMMCGFASVTQQLNDAKYEALKNKEKLYSQAATNFAQQQMEAYKNKAELAMQLADVKFDACRNKDALSRQMDECCCEIQKEVNKDACDIVKKLDECCCEEKELIRAIDTTRIRDNLERAAFDNTFLRYIGPGGYGAEDPYYDDYGYYGYRRRGRGGRRGDEKIVNDTKVVVVEKEGKGKIERKGRRRRDFDSYSSSSSYSD